MNLAGGQTTVLNYTVWMTPLDTAHAVNVPFPTAAEVVVAKPLLPGLEFHIPPNTTITDIDGKAASQISITPIPVRQPPFPLPQGVAVPIYFTIQPGGGYITVAGTNGTKGGRLIYPNAFNQPAGTRFDFWNYDAGRRDCRKEEVRMSNRTLFEALTGYQQPAKNDTSVPEIMSAGAAAIPDGNDEPSEDQFEEILQNLHARADADPEFARKLQDAFGVKKDAPSWKEQLRQSRDMVAESKESVLLGAGVPEFVDQDETSGPELLGVASDFSDQYIQEHVAERYWTGLSRINLDPKQHRFEDDNPVGILGWLVFNGPGAVAVPRSLQPPHAEQFGRINGAEQFRRHGNHPFVYTLNMPAGGRTRVALFADFGTGLGHSMFIARQIDIDRYDAAVSLGDVYYTGTMNQYQEFFEKPLDPVLRNGTQLFVIPDNHDGYSGFHAYVDFLDRRLRQKGSYFALETEHVQFIGVDTIWHSDRGRIQDEGVREWLRARFAAGRSARRANVLLTGHHPYEYQNTSLNALNNDVISLANESIDLWFWGNTHYCALFDRTPATPYYGSCIGHAGYPYKKQATKDAARPSAAPVLFVEAGSRYEGSDVRTDRGMNGFCSFEIEPGGAVELRYRDWRGHDRCIAKFGKQADGSLQLSAALEDRSAVL